MSFINASSSPPCSSRQSLVNEPAVRAGLDAWTQRQSAPASSKNGISKTATRRRTPSHSDPLNPPLSYPVGFNR